MAVYCPQWVYAACVGLTARDFLVKDIPIDLMARRYSKALLESDIIWGEETIHRLFTDGPDVVTPGTKMPIQRMKNDSDRQDLVSYLKQVTTPKN